ncbi:hypothetical protein HY493_00055 [Candidatus Woesearchaeota archaeon]|nr:hypothetical protein [Candidatus Woesearchaeota archaeon]
MTIKRDDPTMLPSHVGIGSNDPHAGRSKPNPGNSFPTHQQTQGDASTTTDQQGGGPALRVRYPGSRSSIAGHPDPEPLFDASGNITPKGEAVAAANNVVIDDRHRGGMGYTGHLKE